MKPLLEVQSLSFTYPGTTVPALHNINLQVASGELVGITGPGGAGKTTLLHCLAGIIPKHRSGAYSGGVQVEGHEIARLSRAAAARTVGIVLQDPEAQLVAPVVEEEIAFGLENLGLPPAEIAQRIDDALHSTGIFHLRQSACSRLSGGQKQRVAIAAVLAMRPRVLLLDEPTAELDPRGSRQVFQTLRCLATEHKMAILVVEQKINLLAEYCSRLVVMEQGKIILDGPVRQVLIQKEAIQRTGCGYPPVSELALLLKEHGLYQGELPVTVEEAYLMVSQVLAQSVRSHNPTRAAVGGGGN
ncbi:MAG: energy-coupling factor ABC transporter ATP-binding protein [Bacillota bacterium]|uniref:energy-coupling factor ABC transporter ATP-binding protein n=1 Tax=Desulfurispora thermophila TaxID=265470 RepID=UPI000366DF4C|nr:ATP-binding cassette domain-containing protein [Desulfurispora thermophila]